VLTYAAGEVVRIVQRRRVLHALERIAEQLARKADAGEDGQL
jgi:hypothetical protein